MDVQITYETLFDLLRKERSLNELQLLDELFWKDVVLYLSERESSLVTKSALEKEKLSIKIRNSKRILKEIFERREQKIVDLAINVAKTETQTLVDKTNMLPEERSFFDDVISLLKKYKSNVLHQVFTGSLPSMSTSAPTYFEKTHTQKVSEVISASTSTDSSSSDTSADYSSTSSKEILENPVYADTSSSSKEDDLVKEEKKQNKSSSSPAALDDGGATLIVKFTTQVPKFLGKHKEIFGPFIEGKIVQLPAHIANILLKKGKVEPVLAS